MNERMRRLRDGGGRPRAGLAIVLLELLLKSSGGKMNGKFLLAVAVVAIVVVAGFVVFRLVMLDVIMQAVRR
ncbi:hypothetical protein [Nonomuraea pusilla]|uniref:Uncharacterized protein n=1 Tax=Nonomuraea pusilla TaxID=46177 RepID=A0A1H7WT25_9ACTN|nr:hypothetical protein [Nonomuraea pusilla]SEM24623.1 hypothetical protein SAMN05660976_04580 [Nonomuraea pusilla]